MALHLTPALLEAAYELLRTTPPFKRWKLPHADAVEFHVFKARHRRHMADYEWFAVNGKASGHRIRIAVHKDHRLLTGVVASMAHEMCHMRQRLMGTDYASHGRVFKRLAAQVCRAHGWQLDSF